MSKKDEKNEAKELKEKLLIKKAESRERTRRR